MWRWFGESFSLVMDVWDRVSSCLRVVSCSEAKKARQGVACESKHQEEKEHQELVDLLILETVSGCSVAQLRIATLLV